MPYYYEGKSTNHTHLRAAESTLAAPAKARPVFLVFFYYKVLVENITI